MAGKKAGKLVENLVISWVEKKAARTAGDLGLLLAETSVEKMVESLAGQLAEQSAVNLETRWAEKSVELALKLAEMWELP